MIACRSKRVRIATRATAAALLALSVTMSGCLSTSTDANSPPPNGDATPAAKLDSLQLTNCNNIGAWANDPDRDDESNAPSHWNLTEVPTDQLTSYLAYTCEQVAYQSIERPDIQIIMETPKGVQAPPSCQADHDSLSGLRLLQSFLVNDGDLFAALQPVLGDRIALATISSNHESSPYRIMEFEWSRNEGQTNRITAQVTGEAGQANDFEWTETYAWRMAEGVHLMHIEIEGQTHVGDNYAATGEIHPPHRNPQPTALAWQSESSSRVETSLDIQFHQYEDTKCESPSP